MRFTHKWKTATVALITLQYCCGWTSCRLFSTPLSTHVWAHANATYVRRCVRWDDVCVPKLISFDCKFQPSSSPYSVHLDHYDLDYINLYEYFSSDLFVNLFCLNLGWCSNTLEFNRKINKIVKCFKSLPCEFVLFCDDSDLYIYWMSFLKIRWESCVLSALSWKTRIFIFIWILFLLLAIWPVFI